MKDYISTTDLSHRKKFAQFFTPSKVADFMAEWIMDGNAGPCEILEPAFGLGIFSRHILRIDPDANITGYEVDERILSAAKSIFAKWNAKIGIENLNYLYSPWDKKYDAIICNPPYFKFHDYDNNIFVPLINDKLNLNLTKFANFYTLFLLKSLSQLKPGGKCAYIIPSEFLNSDYGVEVKRHLLNSGMKIHLVIIDFEENIFEDALTTACILLCENTYCGEALSFSRIKSTDELRDAVENPIVVPKSLLSPEEKWKIYYESCNSKKYKNLTDFANYAKVSRGIATGSNSYFTFSLPKAKELGIPEHALLKCVCHSTDISKPIFSLSDFQTLAHNGKMMFLFKGCGNENNVAVSHYIKSGEEELINEKYLCSKRRPWYALEKRDAAPIWVSVFSRKGLKFIRNEANVANLTTFHCVYVTNLFIDIDVFFAYLLTDTAYNIFLDNSRQYGNGLVKFEPNDLNRAKVVDFDKLSQENIFRIKALYSQFRVSGETSIIGNINAIFESVYRIS